MKAKKLKPKPKTEKIFVVIYRKKNNDNSYPFNVSYNTKTQAESIKRLSQNEFYCDGPHEFEIDIKNKNVALGDNA